MTNECALILIKQIKVQIVDVSFGVNQELRNDNSKLIFIYLIQYELRNLARKVGKNFVRLIYNRRRYK